MLRREYSASRESAMANNRLSRNGRRVGVIQIREIGGRNGGEEWLGDRPGSTTEKW
jgi:hypothetical protein